MAWLSGWAYRRKITIDSDDVDATLTWFPVGLYISASSGKTNVNLTGIFTELGANSKKIAVTKSDGETQLYVEVERWDNSNSKAWLWISRDGWEISSSVDTEIYIYYDSSQLDNDTYVGLCADGSTPTEAVWNDNFLAIYHMGTGDDDEYDSAAEHDMTEFNTCPQGEAQFGYGRILDTNDYFRWADGDHGIGSGQFTYEIWSKPTNTNAKRLLYTYHTNNAKGMYISYRTTQDWQGVLVSGGGTTNIFSSDGRHGVNLWHYIVLRRNASNLVDFIVNLSSVGTDTNAGSVDGGYYGFMGCDYTLGFFFIGLSDEFRVSNTCRPNEWLSATSKTVKDEFVTWGDEETPSATVATGAASSISSQSVTMNGTITKDGAQVTQRGFEWGTQSGVYPDDWTESGDFDSGAYSHAQSGLLQGTTYYYRAKIYDDTNDQWVYGSEQSFTMQVRLTITSTPPTSITITVDGSPDTTTYAADYNNNTSVTVVVTESDPVDFGGTLYNFQKWEDDSTNKTRVVTVTGTSGKNIVANYVTSAVGLPHGASLPEVHGIVYRPHIEKIYARGNAQFEFTHEIPSRSNASIKSQSSIYARASAGLKRTQRVFARGIFGLKSREEIQARANAGEIFRIGKDVYCVSRSEGKINRIENKIHNLQVELGELTNELTKSQTTYTQNVGSLLVEVTSKMSEMQKQIDLLKIRQNEALVLSEAKDKALAQTNELKEQLANSEEERKTLHDEITKLKEDKAKIKPKVQSDESFSQQYDELRIRINTLTLQEHQYKRRITKLQSKAKELQAKLGKLEKLLRTYE